MLSSESMQSADRTQVLLVGMLDSIHVARWLSQFKDSSIDFLIFPSKKFRKIHPELVVLSRYNNYRIFGLSRTERISGYLDFLKYVLPAKMGFENRRLRALNKILLHRNFDFIHALELQGAGYLVDSLDVELLRNPSLIVTNWGSDIYFFKKFPDHERRIKSLLAKADFYSAECERDYKLARNLSFSGIGLPCIPNAGGFDLVGSSQELSLPSHRKQILIKGYGGIFGRADLPISILESIAEEFPSYSFHFYSVTEDVQLLLDRLPEKLLSRIRITTVKQRIAHSEMLREFQKSRIYIGCSESDGVSTSFLEALATGAYPIQTGTSCANEWVMKGAVASIVELTESSLLSAIREALIDDSLIDDASRINFSISKKYLSKEVIALSAQQFYLI
ncbi:GT4_WlbH-like domain containing protein [Candidatus Nanopelagicaceae bacterium]